MRPALVFMAGRIAGYAVSRCRARRDRGERDDAAAGHGDADDRGRDRDDDPGHPADGPVAANRGLVADPADGPRAPSRAR